MGLRFCPRCGNMLFVKLIDSRNHLVCRTPMCFYKYKIKRTIIFSSTTFERKHVDEVINVDAAWKNREQTTINCPNCDSRKAYFQQIQTRSADEPMTIFYRCANHDCAHTWKDN